MIVCLCHGINEKKLKQMIADGSETLKALQKNCKAGSDCGQCIYELKSLIETESPKNKKTA